MNDKEYEHIGFTGTRKSESISQSRIADLEIALDDLKIDATYLHHGDCIGMDEIAHDIAKSIGYKIVIHPPYNGKWRAYKEYDKIYEPQTYLRRNQHIVDYSSVLIAVPKTPQNEELRSGTWSTIRYARKTNKQVIII